MNIDIKKYKIDFDTFEESSVIQNLFNVSKERVDKLLKFGFVFHYENKYFEATIEINNKIHKVYIFKAISEKERLVKYQVRISLIDDKNHIYLTGAYQDFYLYHDITEVYHKLNIYAIFNYIYTVYRLNQKEEKETFKQFVSNEKENSDAN
jgi:hypothetical protein